MSSSRLADHLPFLFGPSRRAAWRLVVLRRAVAAGALLLALHLTLGAARPPTPPSESPTSGPALTLPLAAPADHLDAGDPVGVYLPGRSEPVVTGATVLAAPAASSAVPTVRVAMPEAAVGDLVQQMAPDAGGSGFVIVRQE